MQSLALPSTPMHHRRQLESASLSLASGMHAMSLSWDAAAAQSAHQAPPNFFMGLETLTSSLLACADTLLASPAAQLVEAAVPQGADALLQLVARCLVRAFREAEPTCSTSLNLPLQPGHCSAQMSLGLQRLAMQCACSDGMPLPAAAAQPSPPAAGIPHSHCSQMLMLLGWSGVSHSLKYPVALVLSTAWPSWQTLRAGECGLGSVQYHIIYN